MTRSSSKPREDSTGWSIRTDTAALGAIIVLAPQFFGGAFPWTLIPVVGMCLGALGLALFVRRKAHAPILDGLFLVMAGAWAWTCVQAVPMPETLATNLNLATVENAARLEGLVWTTNVPLTVSLDPGATLAQVLIGIGILSAFLAARLGAPENLKPLAAAIVFSALLLALEGVTHRLLQLDAVFGSYAPRFAKPQLLTPLMNGNHLGGFATMASLLAAGLTADRRAPFRRGWAVASVLLGLTAALTLSRGAIGSLVFGFALLALWLRTQTEGATRRGFIPLLLLGAALAGTAVFAGLEPLLRRFETQGFDKLAVASRGFELLEGPTWWLGIGRGAFSSTFVAEEGSGARFTHPENLIVQWITEWGVPVGLVLLVALAFALVRRLRGTANTIGAAGCIAVIALALQNMVDFSLEMAGVVVVVAALLGALLPPRRTEPVRWHQRFAVGMLGVFALVFVSIAPRIPKSDPQSIVDSLTSAMRRNDEAAFAETLGRGLALHPTEPAMALLAGTYAGALSYPDAPRWLSVAMEEAPGWAAPHVVASRWLLARGSLDQALLEIHEAESRHPGTGKDLLCEALTLDASIEHVLRAAPIGDSRIAFLERATSCGTISPELRASIDLEILELDATRPSAVLRQARRLESKGQQGAALELVQAALEQRPEDASLWAAVIRSALGQEDFTGAETALEDARSRGLDTRALTEADARIAAARGDADGMRRATARLRGQARGSARLVAASFLLEGDLEASLGNVDEALDAYRAADRADSSSPALFRSAELALDAGRKTQARRLFRILCQRKPGSAACAKQQKLEGLGEVNASPSPVP
ncbi:MAG: O-antigen ligase family protein [Myxococcota bacterium]